MENVGFFDLGKVRSAKLKGLQRFCNFFEKYF